jgi:hypothetical protein
VASDLHFPAYPPIVLRSHYVGRARLSSDVSEIKLVFSIPPERPEPNFAANWNVAPPAFAGAG